MVDTLCNNLCVKRFVNSPVPSNAFLVVDEFIGRCIAVDPGTKEQTDMREYISSHGLMLDYILLTHEHFDHCWGVNYLKDYFPWAKTVATTLCAEWVSTPMNYFNKLYFDSEEMFSSHVDVLAEEVGWLLRWNDIDIRLIDAKGHTNRGMCISVGNALFSGDTMIYQTKPFLKKKYGASIKDLKITIDRIYQTFDGDTVVYPGHEAPFRLKEMQAFYEEYFKEMLSKGK